MRQMANVLTAGRIEIVESRPGTPVWQVRNVENAVELILVKSKMAKV